jgi:pyruvate/2-oxoglutarate dehydrogenase complex dihydrolipoamide dehydrogenase (E3) component
VDYTLKGIKVDRHMRTSNAHIYACGDVTGIMPFTHVAEYQAGIVIGNALFRFPKKAAYSAVPWVIFTDPELARVGPTEEEARNRLGEDVRVWRRSFDEVDRAITDGHSEGVVKLIADQADAEGLNVETVCFEFQNIDRAKIEGSTLGLAKLTLYKGRIIGASILGPHAGELVHELALAVAKGCTLGDISGVVNAYPTLAEINRRAANAYLSSRLFSNTSKRLVGLLNRWLA